MRATCVFVHADEVVLIIFHASVTSGTSEYFIHLVSVGYCSYKPLIAHFYVQVNIKFVHTNTAYYLISCILDCLPDCFDPFTE